MDPLGQLTLCCGLGGRRRDYKEPRGHFYSPSAIHLDPGSSWTMPGRYNPPPNQPYLILTQPMMFANHPGANHTNTMTLVQHSQTAPANQAFPAIPFFAGAQGPMAVHQPNMMTSQYAIYDSHNSALVTALARPESIYQTNVGQMTPLQSPYKPQSKMSQQPARQPMILDQGSSRRPDQVPESRVVGLSSKIFRQLELIERQIDLSRDMELVERHGIVMTRALNPYSLMPHLTEATLRRYDSHFLLSNEYVIRFIEIIKRPGQTLGLYIRTVTFEDPNGRSREGLVITKIDADSPIYDSQVLHVGDEILSVNLVEVQNISLDDVVIIMSMPKRLVLALRIPKDRDQVLSMNLLQQQQLLRDSIDQRENNLMRSHQSKMNERSVVRNSQSNLGSMYGRMDDIRTDIPMDAATRVAPGQPLIPYNTLPLASKQPLLGSIRLGETPEQSSYFSSSIDAINRELKELRSQRMALGDEEACID